MELELLELAGLNGFSHYAALEPQALVFRKEVREMCSADRCGAYGKRWSCPPACGSLEFFASRAARYTSGVLVQTTGAMDDEFDLESIARTNAEHKRRFDDLARQARLLWPDCMPMSAGTCTRCHKCSCPDRPCRFPSKLYPSMEAGGLLVSEVCERCGLQYGYGERTVTFTSCILI